MNDIILNDMVEADWRRLLTPKERARMLDDIARVSLAIGTVLFPKQHWQDLDVSVGSLAARKSPMERLTFIESALPVLTQAVGQISRFPLQTMTTSIRPIAPPIRARKVSAQAVLQATRRGPSARHWNETIITPSYDTPENRAIKSFGWLLQRECVEIARIADAEGEGEAGRRAETCAVKLRGLFAETWWEEVTKDSASWAAPPTQRAIARPAYALIFTRRDHYRKEFALDWHQPLFHLPSRETWRLYETWCLFRVLDALILLGYAPSAGTDTFRLREGRLLVTLAQGESARIALTGPQGRRLFLSYNRTFTQGDRSLSRTMQPDITLEDADSRSLWILDAKFKAYALPGEEISDINQMHAYRDAILGLNGERVVFHAWCLYAGLTGGLNREQINYGTSNGPVGALCLRPGSEGAFTNLCDLLTAWLTAEPPPLARPGFPENAPAHR